MTRTRPWVASLVVAVATAMSIHVSPANALGVATANPDAASVTSGVLLTVSPPGVLGNDVIVLGSGAAELVTDVSHGTLTLDANGGYRYRSTARYVGNDEFTYRIPGGLLVLPSLPARVRITVTAPPPTPTPPPPPTPTPAPTPTPTPTPTPRPTLPPLPSLPPLVDPIATPSEAPTPDPTARPTPSDTGPPSSAGSPLRSPDAGGPAGPVGPPAGGASPPPDPAGSPDPADGLSVEVAAAGGRDVDVDIGSLTFDGFEWAVPALVLTVPGLLLMIIVAQSMIGLAWLPVVRRWLGSDRKRRRRTGSAVSSG
ncbi:MAG TPA: Ig-like domain-containing protein [Candidatus Limnocylindrales bacterium]|nr:Ig-like domain-containing protein [Candidatus Limnocylindrales bacterium]